MTECAAQTTPRKAASERLTNQRRVSPLLATSFAKCSLAISMTHINQGGETLPGPASFARVRVCHPAWCTSLKNLSKPCPGEKLGLATFACPGK